MSQKFTATIFFALSFAVISSWVSADEETETQKQSVKETVKLTDERPTTEVGEPEKSHGEITDEMVHDRLVELHEQLAELKRAAENLRETGDDAERLVEVEEEIARQERERKKLTAQMKHGAKKRHSEDGEAQIHNLRRAIEELRHALEHHPDSPKADAWREALHEHEERLESLMAEFHETPRDKRRFPDIEDAIELTEMELMELRHMAEDLREGERPDKLEMVEHEIAEREERLEELSDHLEEMRTEHKQGKARAKDKLAIFRLKHADALELAEVIEPFLTHSGVIAVYLPSNALVIRDSRIGLEAVHMIIKSLDMPNEAGTHHEMMKDK